MNSGGFFYFGPDPDRRMLGALARAKRLRARSSGILLCNPFGEEAVRAHRSYRVLATQLVRLGYNVLRFDYSCTGDSMGDARDATLDGWLDDVRTAHAELMAKTNDRGVVIVGLRLGATLGALATTRKDLAVRHLVLWDPVVDGEAYLHSLARTHREYMRGELGHWTAAHEAALVPAKDGFPTEVLGAPISAELARALASVDLASEPLRAAETTVISTLDEDASIERLRRRLHPGAPGSAPGWISIKSRTPWNSDSALNSQLVPMDVIERMMRRIEEVSP